MSAGDALERAIAGMDRRAAELVAKWRAEDAERGVRRPAIAWPGRVPKHEPTEYWGRGETAPPGQGGRS